MQTLLTVLKSDWSAASHMGLYSMYRATLDFSSSTSAGQQMVRTQ